MELTRLHGTLLRHRVTMKVVRRGRSAAGDVAGVAGTLGVDEAPAGEESGEVAAFAE